MTRVMKEKARSRLRVDRRQWGLCAYRRDRRCLWLQRLEKQRDQLCWRRADRLRLSIRWRLGGRHPQHVRRDRHSSHQNVCRPKFANGSGTVESKVKWFDALTGRLGYLVAPNWLLYGQGGAAWTKAEVSAFNGLGAQVGSISGNSRTGWTAGAGVEWMFVPHWSAFIEYNYMGFGTRSSSFPRLRSYRHLPHPERQNQYSGCSGGREL